MKFWEKMGKKKNGGSEPELTPLERRLAEKAEKEENEANAPKGPKTLKEAVESISELEDRLLRLTAESGNYRKRVAREKEEARLFANQSFIEKLLPVMDNFQMALDAAKDADPAVRDGVQMILRQLKGVLQESGVEEVDGLGQIFNPELHEAVSQEEAGDVEEGTVVQQLRKGYRLHERLIRPASVVVAKRPAAESEEPGI